MGRRKKASRDHYPTINMFPPPLPPTSPQSNHHHHHHHQTLLPSDPHIPLFHLRSQINPLPLITPDFLNTNPDLISDEKEEDPFLPTGFITTFSTFSLEHSPLFVRSAPSVCPLLSDLERAVLDPSGSGSSSLDSMVSVDNLRAYLHIIEVASILGLEKDVSEHAFQLFKDCSLVTCLRNRSIEGLATAALVQAIRVAQEPRTLQEISSASNLPQKEIGKYMKILGESLQLSQPINSNSISVHMPRFCTLLHLNKSAQNLAAHIGEVVINKCFCTRRNPISISAAAIYLACQLEDKRKTQAEICKVTGLTEVTLRKVYKELLENWDDLLPPNYTPAVPPEKAFPMTLISSTKACSVSNADNREASDLRKGSKEIDVNIEPRNDRSLSSLYTRDFNKAAFWQSQFKKSDVAMKVDDCAQSSSGSSSQRHGNNWQFTASEPSTARFGEFGSGNQDLNK